MFSWLGPRWFFAVRQPLRYTFRIPCSFDGKDGHVVPDQLRTLDRERLVKRLGVLPEATLLQALAVLQEMFAPKSYAREGAMQTLSVHLDDGSEAMLNNLCQALGISQSEVVKVALVLLHQQSTSRGTDHAALLRQKLRDQHMRERQAGPQP